MIKTLHFKIGSLISGLIFCTAIVLLFVVWFATGQLAQSHVEKELRVGVNVLNQALNNRQTVLLNSAEILTTDFGFRKAVASFDIPTVESALDNHGARIHSDLMAILTLDGDVTTSVGVDRHDIDTRAIKTMSGEAKENGRSTRVIPIHGRLFQVVMLPVKAPIPIAIAMLGFELDQDLALHLQKMTDLHISFMWHHHDKEYLLSTIDSMSIEELKATANYQPEWRLPYTYSTEHQSVESQLNDDVLVSLSVNLHKIYEDIDALQLSILMITLISIPIAILFGLSLANNLTSPLKQLLFSVQSIASGNYDRPIDDQPSTQEISSLTDAFKIMQGNILTREEKILYQSNHDLTTGLINRQAFSDYLEDSSKHHHTFQLISFSLRSIHQTSTMFGPEIIDTCMKHISTLLEVHFVTVGRFSDERFIAYTKKHLEEEDILDLCHQLEFELDQRLQEDNVSINTEFYAATISYPDHVHDISMLLRCLDIVMDLAENSPEKVHCYQTEQEQRYLDGISTVEDLRGLLRNKSSGLMMYYQPKLNLQNNEVTQFEALIRWIHPERGFIGPDFFIPLAEQAGLINQLTEWVLATVIHDIFLWKEKGYDMQVAVNLSAQDIARDGMLAIIQDILSHYHLPPQCIALEITESELMKNPAQAAILLERFREHGFDIAIDDFGTGYSSLAQLKNMPVTDLKIDREFVMKLINNEDDQIIVNSTINLAHSFNLHVVAEGVEDGESLELLRSLGCERAQGYYIARPMPFDDVLPWIGEHRSKSDVDDN